MRVKILTLGYTNVVFENLTFSLRDTERVFIKGRNGAGKSTLVRTIMALAHDKQPAALTLAGEVILSKELHIGEYEQEISAKYLSLPLEEAIRKCYVEKKVFADDRKIKSMMAQYLFDPILDGQQKIINLSGGQKARFQLIKMFIGEPNLLILDEPTNHLDLPSIEELENTLSTFKS